MSGDNGPEAAKASGDAKGVRSLEGRGGLPAAEDRIEMRHVPLRAEDARSALLLLLGLALALFAVCSLFGSAAARVDVAAGVDGRFLVDTLLMACAFLCLVGLRVFARPLSAPRGLRALAVVAFVGTVPCPLILATPVWPLGIPCVAAGSVALVFLWWSHACTVGRTLLSLVVAGAVSLAGALLALTSFLPAGVPQTDYLSDMASLASCLLLLGVQNDLRDRLLQVSVAESRDRRRNRMYSRLGELNYFSVGVILGADGGLWVLLSRQADGSLLPPVLLMGAALVAAGTFLGVACRARGFDMERLSKDYLCATLALGYLLLPLVGGLGTGLVYVYLVAVVFVQACIVFLAGAELVRFEELSPLYSFSEAAYLVGGSVIGALGVFAVGLLVPGQALVAACAAVVLYAAVVQVQLNRVSFPEDWSGADDPAPAASAAAPGEPAPAPEPASDDDGPDDKLIPAGSYLRRRLDDIGAHYGLSPRQCEILDLLARGRDTQYIMDRFTISRATAKTHVYNIYRKLDIHSRQDLYDLIEGDDFTSLETPGQGINPRV